VGKTTDAIAPLSIAALRLPPDIVDILIELGIAEIGQLLALPRDAVAARFDPKLLLRLDQATGLVPETIASQRPLPEITSGIELEYPTADQHALDVVLRELLERLTRNLAEREQGAIQIECRLQCEDTGPIEFVVGLFRASAHAAHLLELARMQLERLSLPGPVTAVKLAVLVAASLRLQQRELFEQRVSEGRRQVGLLVDRLSNRLGREAVVRAIPQADAQPELAFRYEPLAGVTPRNGPPPRWKPLPRPLRLEHPPIALEVLSVVPHGPPIQFPLDGDMHRVARAWGPERIQTGWWRGRYVQRDYYRIETTTGRRFWLFRRLNDAKWFLHGAFE
jgi:protein ImuB